MRHIFFYVVLVAYVWAAPPGRPDTDFFDSEAVGIMNRAEAMQEGWSGGAYARILAGCPMDKRSAGIKGLLDSVGTAHEVTGQEQHAGLNAKQGEQIADFRRRFKALNDAVPGLPYAGAEVVAWRAKQQALYVEIMGWLRANDRLEPATLRIFTASPVIVKYDRNRAIVAFCADERREALDNVMVTFKKIGSDWTWDLLSGTSEAPKEPGADPKPK